MSTQDAIQGNFRTRPGVAAWMLHDRSVSISYRVNCLLPRSWTIMGSGMHADS